MRAVLHQLTQSRKRTVCPARPQSEWDVSGAATPRSRASPPTSASTQGRPSSSRSTRRRPPTTSTSTAWATTAATGRAQGRDGHAVGAAAADASRPACTDAATGLIDCGNWAVSASWTVPADAVSGIYFAKLVARPTPAARATSSFVVRDDASHSDVLFQTSDTTWQAYNQLRRQQPVRRRPGHQPGPRATRSATTGRSPPAAPSPEDWVFNAEYPMVRWLEANGYDVSYFTGVDTRPPRRADPERTRCSCRSATTSTGRAQQRANVEAARDAGVNLAFFSGNEVFWKTRWENSIDGSAHAVPHAGLLQGDARQRQDRSRAADLDRHVARPALQPAGRRRPAGERADRHHVHGQRAARRPITGARRPTASCGSGATPTVAAPGAAADRHAGRPARSGYEWDEDLDNGFRPAGLIQLSTTTVDASCSTCRTTAHTYGTGTATHHLTLYRAPSGALVFGAGTVQWSWGLDATHDRGSGAADPRDAAGDGQPVRRHGRAARHAAAGTRPPPRRRPTPSRRPSSDHLTGRRAPRSGRLRRSPITGTATDTGGGVVGGVEVSVDGGTWHPATGRENWSYSWIPSGDRRRHSARARGR